MFTDPKVADVIAGGHGFVFYRWKFWGSTKYRGKVRFLWELWHSTAQGFTPYPALGLQQNTAQWFATEGRAQLVVIERADENRQWEFAE